MIYFIGTLSIENLEVVACFAVEIWIKQCKKLSALSRWLFTLFKQIDDCRRTHNYDEFICTFLSMLAQQGKLADLVQQHLVQHRKPGLAVPRVQRFVFCTAVQVSLTEVIFGDLGCENWLTWLLESLWLNATVISWIMLWLFQFILFTFSSFTIFAQAYDNPPSQSLF